jgi:beta-N-acetylhexosaminidase
MLQKINKSFFVGLLALSGVNFVIATDHNEWVEAVLARLSLRQKIGQLMMISVAAEHEDPGIFAADNGATSPALKEAAFDRMAQSTRMIRENGVGGVICFKGDPASQSRLLTELQEVSEQALELPLLVGQDAEWGLAMRLQNVPRFPKNMTLGAIQDKRLLREFGEFVGFMCRAVGVHLNFAPVVDCNTNPNNPVIGIRAFHEDPEEVYKNAVYVIEGMLSENIVPVIKHAFGHGDTIKDSHKSLPKVTHGIERLKRVEMHSFKKLIKKFGARIGVMMGHMAMPALTKEQKTPVSFSQKAIGGIMRRELGFGGLIVTDALNMRAITKRYSKDLAVLTAFAAGNDILLYPEDVAGGIKLIEILVRHCPFYAEQLDNSVRRILRVKKQIIEQGRVMPYDLKVGDFATNHNILELKCDLYEAAITMVRDEQKLLPLQKSGSKIGYLKIGGVRESLAQVQRDYPQLVTGYVGLDQDSDAADGVLKGMADCDVIIVALGRVLEQQSPYGSIPAISPVVGTLLGRVFALPQSVVLSVLTSPYALKFLSQATTCVEAYEDDIDAEIGALKVIFGDLEAKGTLPITVA